MTEPSASLVKELNADWNKLEGDYNVFRKEMLAKIAKAFDISPQVRLHQQASFNRILTGDFQVAHRERHNDIVIE